MTENEQIVNELRQINQSLKKLTFDKTPFFNFLNGFLHSFGAFLGNVLIFALIFYILSRINFGEILTNWLKSAIPTPAPLFKLDLPKL